MSTTNHHDTDTAPLDNDGGSPAGGRHPDEPPAGDAGRPDAVQPVPVVDRPGPAPVEAEAVDELAGLPPAEQREAARRAWLAEPTLTGAELAAAGNSASNRPARRAVCGGA